MEDLWRNVCTTDSVEIEGFGSRSLSHEFELGDASLDEGVVSGASGSEARRVHLMWVAETRYK